MATTPRSIDTGVGVGEIFLDKFRVDAILGHGGMGVVALCTHLALNERVAIKMLRRDVLDDADAVERFMREAQAASKLKSEYVARVTDVGRSGANVPYMVMEYLDGHDLDELLQERGSLGLPWAVELTLQACEALAEAHSIGIVHRDVKPSNLFVTWRPDGSALIKVLDFGISKALTGDAMRLTQTQSLLGTPAYMSPEQMRSARHVDVRTDIWSLGTVLYEMLEGRRPFEAESFSEMCVKVAVDPPGAMTHTPLALQYVVLRCLAKVPEQRYASMAELGRDLVPFSQDPHQAQVLAERMERTLRRSQIFDANPSRHGSRSGQRTVELSSAGSSPVLALPAPPVVAPTADPASAVPRPSPPAAFRPLSSTYVVPRRRRWSAILVVVALAGAATVGVAVSRGRDRAPVPSNRPAVHRAPTASPTAPPVSDPQPAHGSPPPGTAAAAADPIDRARPGNDPSAAQPPATPEPRDPPAPSQAPKPDRSTAGSSRATRPPGPTPAARSNDKPGNAVAKPPCDPYATSSAANAANACPGR